MKQREAPREEEKPTQPIVQPRPSRSALWDRPELFEATYKRMKDTTECSIFEIKSRQGLKYILYSRKLPSGMTEKSQMRRTFMEECEIFKLCFNENLLVPKLVDTEISKRTSFWNGDTYFYDILFLLPDAENEYMMLEDYIKDRPAKSSLDFQLLSDIASTYQTFMNHSLTLGYLLPHSFIVQIKKELGNSGDSERTMQDKPDKTRYDRCLALEKPGLLVLSVGIIDREIRKIDKDDQGILRENKVNLMTLVCQMASGAKSPCSLHDSMEKLDLLQNCVSPEDREKYKADMSNLLTDLISNTSSQEDYKNIQIVLKNHMKTEIKEFELSSFHLNENVFTNPQNLRRNENNPVHRRTCCQIKNKLLIIGIKKSE